MLTDRESRAEDWGHPLPLYPRCQWCERSLVTRFGGELAPLDCPSCEADFQRELTASGGLIEVVEDEAA